MSLYEENGLPGVFTEVVTSLGEDYDTSQFGVGDSICLVGTAFDGPVGKAVKIYSPAHGRYIFGKSFDKSTRKEATLTAGIQDAWDRGCRTIYAVRIGGKEIYKDFQLAVDSNFKLRVSGLFPSNKNKELSFVYKKGSGSDGGSFIRVIKNADRATVKEKKYGLVNDSSQVIVTDIRLSDNGINDTTELVELIKVVNRHQFNNVMKLSIVDENGNDVTLSSRDAKAILVRDMFEGAYLIGKASNIDGAVETKVALEIREDGTIAKVIEKNTNIAKDYPLFCNKGNLNNLLGESGVDQYGFLLSQSTVKKIFEDDSVDYEEVDMSLYEAYEKLGSGYAINAKLEEKNGKFKVVEVTNSEDRVSAIKNGIYSTLENLEVDYRVLLGFNADDKIKGRLPRPSAFKACVQNEMTIDTRTLRIVPVLAKDDFTAEKRYDLKIVGKSSIDNIDTDKIDLSKIIRSASLVSGDAIQELNKAKNEHLKTKLTEGSLLLKKIEGSREAREPGAPTPAPEKYELYIYTNGKAKTMHTPTALNEAIDRNPLNGSIIFANGKMFVGSGSETIKDVQHVRFKEAINIIEVIPTGKEYVVVNIEKDVFMLAKAVSADGSNVPKGEGGAKSKKAKTAQDGLAFEMICTCDQAFSASEEKLHTAFTSSYAVQDIVKETVSPATGETFANTVVITTDQHDYMTIDEFATALNEDKDFSKFFKAVVISDTEAQKYLEDILKNSELVVSGFVDRKIEPDTNKFIRFRTLDNFARQLAQHCAYASLKTNPTHGFIGVSTLLNTSLESIDNKVQSLIALQLESTLVAKKDNGQNLLVADSMPFHIGRHISIPVCQYPVTTSDGHIFISNLAAGYAGMVSRLPVDQSSTCQPISLPNASVIFNQYQLKSLTNAGFVTVKDSENKGLVITDGVTMAAPQDVFRRLSCCRVANAIDDILRGASEPFIGKQNSPANQNSLRTAIKSALDSVKDKLIEGYEFRMSIDSTTKQLGKINIFYKIVPVYEIKEIKNHITI